MYLCVPYVYQNKQHIVSVNNINRLFFCHGSGVCFLHGERLTFEYHCDASAVPPVQLLSC
jgi:hypothetical protein